QIAQIARRILQSLDRIERIDEAAIVRGSRHELGNALRALAAHRARVEAAFLPDDAGEELDRQFVLGRILFKRAANIGCRRGVRSGGGLGCGRWVWGLGVWRLLGLGWGETDTEGGGDKNQSSQDSHSHNRHWPDNAQARQRASSPIQRSYLMAVSAPLLLSAV